jgi:ABC-type sugar transport system ATPase subunit
MAEASRPLIEMKNIDLYFGTFHALKDVSVNFDASRSRSGGRSSSRTG